MHRAVLRWTDGQMDRLVDGENCIGMNGRMDGWIARQTDKYYPQSSFGRLLNRRKHVPGGHRGK